MSRFPGMWELQMKAIVIEKSRWGTNGLKRHRGDGANPDHKCSNCRCTRYAPCTCMHKDIPVPVLVPVSVPTAA